MRKFLITFLSTFIIILTLSGFLVAGYRTKSALTTIDSPASFKISEDGENYIFSFLGEELSFPRDKVKKVTLFFRNDPSYIPIMAVIYRYISDNLGVFYRL